MIESSFTVHTKEFCAFSISLRPLCLFSLDPRLTKGRVMGKRLVFHTLTHNSLILSLDCSGRCCKHVEGIGSQTYTELKGSP